MSIQKTICAIKNKIKHYLSKKMHRSFRMTKRRDNAKSFNVPGLLAFTVQVYKVLWKNRKTFIALSALVIVATVLLIGMGSQDTYSTMVGTLNSTSGDFFSSAFGKIESAGLLFLAAASGGIAQTLNSAQQIYLLLITLFTWLITVWLMRNILSGNKVKLRDSIYSSGAPIIATILLTFVAVIQLIPFVIVLICISAATSTGLLDGGVEAMLFWVAAGLLTLLSVYWLSSTFFAMIIATIPGMYPFKALKIASEVVMGRRLKIIIRLLWLALVTCIAWTIVFIPVILADQFIKDIWKAIEWFPTIPILLLFFTALTTVWVSSYIYMLYRKIVDNESK
jgi:hypothetical protein